MTEARCPEPKPTTVFFLTLAGVVAGISAGFIGPILSDLASYFYDPIESAERLACLAGCMGLAIGTILAISQVRWVRATLACATGFLTYPLGDALFQAIKFGASPNFDMEKWRWGLDIGVPTMFMMVLCHDYALRHKGKWRTISTL